MGLKRTVFFAATPPGLEPVCAAELNQLGFENTRIFPGGAAFSGDFETMCAANLCLRTASRVLLRAAQFFAVHLAQLHKKASRVPWEEFLSPNIPTEVRASCRKSKIYHSEAAAERVAKGIAERLGLSSLPSFAEGAPEEAGGKTCVLVRIDRDRCTLSIDTSGAHLHRRGYRLHVGAAPLRENLAAAVLMMSDWSFENECLVDPMCGSGTIPIEAALIAGRIPPGLYRPFGFEKLAFFEKKVFEEIKAKLQSRIVSPPRPIFASDIDEEAVRIASANAERAGVLPFLEIKKRDAAELDDKTGLGDSLVICNPPYGKRIGERRGLRTLYRSLGDAVRRMPRARLALVTGDPTFASATRLSLNTVSPPFPNGGIRVRLFSTEHSAGP